MKINTIKALTQMNSAVTPTTIKSHLNKFMIINFILLTCLIGTSVFAAPRGVEFDYFGTGRSNYVVFNVENGQLRWDILENTVTNPAQTRRVFWGFEYPNDFVVLGDYDGDMKNDIGVWRPGDAQNPQSLFYIQRSTNPDPNAIFGQPWGSPTDLPLQLGDFDGDGIDDFTVVREEDGNFSHYILPSGGGGFRRIVFGLTSDFLVTGGGDLTGDGRDEVIIYRDDENGQTTVFAADSVTGSLVFSQEWGTSAGYEMAFGGYGDYLGDSRADLVHIFGECGGCAAEGTWWIKETGGDTVRAVKFGIPLNADFEGDYPLFDSDFDGDGKLDVAVFRLSNSTFYSLNSSDGQLKTQYFDGNSTLPPLSEANPSENRLEPRGKSIPAAALKARVVARQPDGTYRVEQAGKFYLKK